jgi:hypothetical protein
LRNYYNCWKTQQIKENEDAGVKFSSYWEGLKKIGSRVLIRRKLKCEKEACVAKR